MAFFVIFQTIKFGLIRNEFIISKIGFVRLRPCIDYLLSMHHYSSNGIVCIFKSRIYWSVMNTMY